MKTRNLITTGFVVTAFTLFLASCDKTTLNPGGGNGEYINYALRINSGYDEDKNEMKDVFYLELKSDAIDESSTTNTVAYYLKSYTISVDGKVSTDSLYNSDGKPLDLSSGTGKQITFGYDNKVVFYLKDYTPGQTVSVDWTVLCSIGNLYQNFTYTSKNSDKDFNEGKVLVHTVEKDWSAIRYAITPVKEGVYRDNSTALINFKFERDGSYPDYKTANHSYELTSVTQVGNTNFSESMWTIYDSKDTPLAGRSSLNFNSNSFYRIEVKETERTTMATYRIAFRDKWLSSSDTKIAVFDYKSDVNDALTFSVTATTGVTPSNPKANYAIEHTVISIIPNNMLKYDNTDYYLSFSVNGIYSGNYSEFYASTNANAEVSAGNNPYGAYQNIVNFSGNSSSSNMLKVNFNGKDKISYHLPNNILNDTYTLTVSVCNENGNLVNKIIHENNSVTWAEPVRNLTLKIRLQYGGIYSSNLTKVTSTKPAYIKAKYDGIVLNKITFATLPIVSFTYYNAGEKEADGGLWKYMAYWMYDNLSSDKLSINTNGFFPYAKDNINLYTEHQFLAIHFLGTIKPNDSQPYYMDDRRNSYGRYRTYADKFSVSDPGAAYPTLSTRELYKVSSKGTSKHAPFYAERSLTKSSYGKDYETIDVTPTGVTSRLHLLLEEQLGSPHGKKVRQGAAAYHWSYPVPLDMGIDMLINELLFNNDIGTNQTIRVEVICDKESSLSFPEIIYIEDGKKKSNILFDNNSNKQSFFVNEIQASYLEDNSLSWKFNYNTRTKAFTSTK